MLMAIIMNLQNPWKHKNIGGSKVSQKYSRRNLPNTMKALSSRDGLTFVSEKRGKSKKNDNIEAKNGFNNNHSI